MTLQFKTGDIGLKRHTQTQSVTSRSISTESLKCTTAEILTSLTVDGAPVVGRTPVTAETETVQVLDTTGLITGSVTTLQAALDALVLAAGASDIAVVSITDGQTVALTADVTFAEVQRCYRRVVVRGAGRTVSFTDTVASVAAGGPGTGNDSWTAPTMTTAMTPSAHVGQIALNTTIGHYFGIKDNDATVLELCAPLTRRSAPAQMFVLSLKMKNRFWQYFDASLL